MGLCLEAVFRRPAWATCGKRRSGRSSAVHFVAAIRSYALALQGPPRAHRFTSFVRSMTRLQQKTSFPRKRESGLSMPGPRLRFPPSVEKCPRFVLKSKLLFYA